MFGAEQTPFPSNLQPSQSMISDSFRSRGSQIFILSVAVASMVALHLFVTRTRYGIAMRATSENLQVAAILGINVNTVILVTFGVASALGGIAGVLVGLNFNAISPFMGIEMGIKGMAVMLIGGLGQHLRRDGRRPAARHRRSAERGLSRSHRCAMPSRSA